MMLNSVIVVDDSEADRYLIKRILGRANIASRLFEFPSGYEALEYCRDVELFCKETGPTPPPTLILLDVNMPRVNGFEFLKELHARVERGEFPPDWVAVMMLTSSSDERDRESAAQFPEVIDYLVKPLTLEKATIIAQKTVASDLGAELPALDESAQP